MRKMLGYMTVFGGIILIALAVPVVILVLGTPLALVVRSVLELGRAL
jgi:hypothetical protein